MKSQTHAAPSKVSPENFLPPWSQNQVPPNRLTTFGLGCALATLLEPNTIDELIETVDQLRRRKQSWRILGAGSNVILPPQQIAEAVIRLGKGFSAAFVCETTPSVEQLLALQGKEKLAGVKPLNEVEQVASTDGCEILAFSACPMMSLSRKTVKLGLQGFEFAAGIPGTIGGGVRMNAGAHGAELGDTLRYVYCLSAKGELLRLDKKDLALAYRTCTLPDASCVIAAQFSLSSGDPKAVSEERTRCLDYRKKTQPLHLPSAGSVFRNPPGERAAAEMLEELGLKGLRMGGLAFSSMHANWLVRVDTKASSEEDASNAAELIRIAQAKVKDAYGITLKPEIQLWWAC